MSRLQDSARAAARLNMPEQPLLINPPRVKLLNRMLRLWLLLFAIVIASAGVFFFITIPAAIFLFFRNYLAFIVQWGTYGYSIKLLHSMTAMVWIAFTLVSDPARTYFLIIISKFHTLL